MKNKDVQPGWGSASRLPEEAAYWDALAKRVTDHALLHSDGDQPIVVPWWSPISRLSPGLVAAALVALIGAAAFLNDREPPTAVEPPLQAFLSPEEPLLKMLLGEREPPVAGAFLTYAAIEEAR